MVHDWLGRLVVVVSDILRMCDASLSFLAYFFPFFKMVLFLSFSFCVQFNIMNRFYFFMPMFLIHFVVACFSKKRFTRKRKKQRMHMLKTSFSLLKQSAQVITIISALSQMCCCWQMSFSPLEVYLLNIMVQIQHTFILLRGQSSRLP